MTASYTPSLLPFFHRELWFLTTFTSAHSVRFVYNIAKAGSQHWLQEQSQKGRLGQNSNCPAREYPCQVLIGIPSQNLRSSPGSNCLLRWYGLLGTCTHSLRIWEGRLSEVNAQLDNSKFHFSELPKRLPLTQGITFCIAHFLLGSWVYDSRVNARFLTNASPVLPVIPF